MAEEEIDDESSHEADGLDGGESPPKRGKRLIIIIAIIVIALIGAGAGLYFSGMLKPSAEKKTEAEEHGDGHGDKKGGEHGEKKADAPTEVYHDLDEFLVNLDAGGKQPSFLKMTVTLVLPDEAALVEIKAKTPRIRDGFQVYLRELRMDDLQGAAGLYRLREELLLRLNKLMHPVVIKDILFKSILVQ